LIFQEWKFEKDQINMFSKYTVWYRGELTGFQKAFTNYRTVQNREHKVVV